MASLKQQSVGPYVITRLLGEGTTGKVKLAYHKDTGEQVAIKVISKASFQQNPNLHRKVHREISLMKLVNHPNILRLIDVLESSRNLYIVLEYAQKGELFDFLVARRCLPEDQAMEFFRQIVLASEYLHSHGICHRDLKPENILLDSNNRVKVADFGFARWVTKMTDTSCGSPHYAAPEVIKGVPYDGRRADIWSMGVILYALLAGYLPFDEPTMRELLHKIRKGEFEIPKEFSREATDLIKKMLVVQIEKRATIHMIKSHPLFRKNMPKCYTFASPIPFRQFSTPIDIKTLAPDVKAVLQQIGYIDEAELEEELRSPTNNMAKVFVAMLTEHLDLEMLPWEEAVNGVVKSPSNGSVSVMMEKHSTMGSDEDSFHRHLLQESHSLDVGSSAVHSDWCTIDTLSVHTSVQEAATEVYGSSIWNVMAHVQEVCRARDFMFLHPEPMVLFARSADEQTYITVTATFILSDEIRVVMELHKGSEELFNETKDQLFAEFGNVFE